eukprot:59140-Pleurochrysis_carterae.AAC.2
MYDDCTCCACLQDSHLETLRYELQGLLDAAVRIGDMEIVKLLAPDASERGEGHPQEPKGAPNIASTLAFITCAMCCANAESWARPIVTVDQVPAELLGLAAARGHLTLVERLLQLSSVRRVGLARFLSTQACSIVPIVDAACPLQMGDQRCNLCRDMITRMKWLDC